MSRDWFLCLVKDGASGGAMDKKLKRALWRPCEQFLGGLNHEALHISGYMLGQLHTSMGAAEVL